MTALFCISVNCSTALGHKIIFSAEAVCTNCVSRYSNICIIGDCTVALGHKRIFSAEAVCPDCVSRYSTLCALYKPTIFVKVKIALVAADSTGISKSDSARF